MSIWKSLFRGAAVGASHGKGIVWLGAGSFAGYNYLFKDKGLVETFSDALFHHKSAAESVTDVVMGKGSYQKFKEEAHGLADDWFGGGNEGQLRGMSHSDHGAGSQSGGVQDFTMDGSMSGGMSSSGGGLFDSLRNLTGSLFSGGKGLSMASMIPAAWLMFGNFGWMGKITSLLLGSLIYRNMTRDDTIQQAMYQGQRQLPRYSHDYVGDSYPFQGQEGEEVVRRGLGM